MPTTKTENRVSEEKQLEVLRGQLQEQVNGHGPKDTTQKYANLRERLRKKKVCKKGD